MSFLTKLPIELYNKDAFKQFTGGTDFEIGNARAMAWMSQLAYETDEPDKIGKILQSFGLDLVEGGVVVEESKTVLPIASTHCFVATGPVVNGTKVVTVAFAGTDPVSLANWISDFDARLRATGTAEGYAAAAEVVWPRLQVLLGKCVPPNGKVYVTGHSMGGALAALTALRISTELQHLDVEAVYTFGMPRPGNQALADRYNQRLGSRTYRLVHGEDLVPTVAPSRLDFRHLGRLLHCERQGRFDKAKLASDTSSDFPPFADGVAKELATVAHGPLSSVVSAGARIKLAAALLTGMGPSSMRTDPGGIAIELLPPRLRDHIPDRYISACNG
jgi:pimeloyl-ACP methyl ester carboxylesterase